MIASGSSSPCIIQFFAFAALISLFILLSFIIIILLLSRPTISGNNYNILLLLFIIDDGRHTCGCCCSTPQVLLGMYTLYTMYTRMRNDKQRREYFPGCEAINYLIYTHCYCIYILCIIAINVIYMCITTTPLIIIILSAVTCHHIIIFLYKRKIDSQLRERERGGRVRGGEKYNNIFIKRKHTLLILYNIYYMHRATCGHQATEFVILMLKLS